MAIANIFKCNRNEIDIIPNKLLQNLNTSYEGINNNASSIALLSKLVKEENKKGYCRLPLCHTVEAEAFGSEVIFSEKVGNRIGNYKIDDMNSIRNISKIDLNRGRISEVLKAISILKKDGENVVLDVTGPISIATSIMDSQLFYKAIRKERKRIDSLLAIIKSSIVEYIIESIKLGVDTISFADPAGAIDIVGPKTYKELSGQVTYDILNEIKDKLENTIVHLCGKTSTSLEFVGLLESERIEVKGKNYFEMIQNIKEERKDVKFIGHWCLKLNKSNNEIINCKIK